MRDIWIPQAEYYENHARPDSMIFEKVEGLSVSKLIFHKNGDEVAQTFFFWFLEMNAKITQPHLSFNMQSSML